MACPKAPGQRLLRLAPRGAARRGTRSARRAISIWQRARTVSSVIHKLDANGMYTEARYSDDYWDRTVGLGGAYGPKNGVKL